MSYKERLFKAIANMPDAEVTISPPSTVDQMIEALQRLRDMGYEPVLLSARFSLKKKEDGVKSNG